MAPAGQGVQVGAPVEAKVAGGQSAGVMDPGGQAEPGGHRVGAPPVQNEPAGQGKQEAPETLKVPMGQ